MEVAVRVPELDLPQLLSWLEQHLPQSLMMFGELKGCLKNRGKRQDFEFYTDRWPDCQAVACKLNPSKENDVLGVFAINDLALSAILKDRRVVDWSKRGILHAIPETFCPVIQSVAEEMQAKASVEKVLLLRATSPELQRIPVPAGMRIAAHSLDHLSAIDSTWKYHSASSEAYITEKVHTFPSVVLTTDSGQHVGHMIGCNFGGMMGMLYVFPQFRRKGYAKVIISQLSQKYFDEGENAYVMIEADNEVSLRLHESLGFKHIKNLTWVILHQKTL